MTSGTAGLRMTPRRRYARLHAATPGLPEVLERMLSTTNAIENLISSVRRVSRRVKHWQDGTMILRWTAAGLQEAEKGFRRVRGYKDLDILEEVLRSNDRRIDGENQEVQAA